MRDKIQELLQQAQALDAKEMDTLIRKLALLRATMEPSVPQTLEMLERDGQVLIEDKPTLSIRARQDGGFRIWLRHRGLSWLGYQIDDASAAGMSNFIRKHLGDGPGVNLISHETSNRH